MNSADYIQIDNGFNNDQGNANPGWYNGDFNYDHAIDGDDYTLIDNAFNTQTAVPLAAVPAKPLAALASCKQLGAWPSTRQPIPAADDNLSRKKSRKPSLIAELAFKRTQK